MKSIPDQYALVWKQLPSFIWWVKKKTDLSASKWRTESYWHMPRGSVYQQGGGLRGVWEPSDQSQHGLGKNSELRSCVPGSVHASRCSLSSQLLITHITAHTTSLPRAWGGQARHWACVQTAPTGAPALAEHFLQELTESCSTGKSQGLSKFRHLQVEVVAVEGFITSFCGIYETLGDSPNLYFDIYHIDLVTPHALFSLCRKWDICRTWLT